MKKIILVYLICLCAFAGKAQGWEKRYSIASGYTRAILPAGDGGYIVAGDHFYMKIDSVGNLLWSNTGLTNYYTLTRTSDNHFLAAGVLDSMTNVTKITPSGNIVYDIKYPVGMHSVPSKIVEHNGNYLVTGVGYQVWSNSAPPFGIQTYLLKTTSSGTLDWFKTYNNNNASESSAGYDIQLDTDNNYIVWGNRRVGFNYRGAQILKVDALTGDTIWTKQIGNSYSSPLLLMGTVTSDKGYISGVGTVDNGSYEYSFNKYNASYQLDWTKIYNIEDANHTYNIKTVAQTPDGGYITGGVNFASLPLVSDMYIAKISAIGDTIWTSKIDNDPAGIIYETITAITVCPDGYIFSTQGSSQLRIIKTDMFGNRITNVISGTIFIDANNNCIKDAGETIAPFGKVNIQPGNIIVSADILGNYFYSTRPGTYSVTIAPSDLWESVCTSSSYSITFNNYYSYYTNADIALKTKRNCIRTKVDVSTCLQRKCHLNNYTVSYANIGTVVSTNTEIELEFDSPIIPSTFSKPYTRQGDKYIFSIGALSPGNTGTIQIEDSINCLLADGSTVCVSAKISPGNNCEAISPNWDNSSISVKGKCLGDTTVKFVVTNNGEQGNGDMEESSVYRLYKDSKLDVVQSFKIPGQDSLLVYVPTDGSTIRLEADQRPDHPGYSFPSKSIEGCITSPTTPSTGFVTMFPEDDRDDTIEVDCQQILNSHDPNDKSVKPSGITNQHFVRSTDELEYLIRFQNTGNDTAFIVKITDIISAEMDMASFTMAGASHNYTYISEGNKVTWTLNNILLPDSSKNQLASNGFVKYKIKPKSTITQGAIIENTANIYFDFNPPVTTNTTSNIINDSYELRLSTQNILPSIQEKIVISVYPNPTNAQSLVNAGKELNGTIQISTMQGIEVLRIPMVMGKGTIDKSILENGIYIVRVSDEKGVSGSVKLVVE
jgi:uncharacterized repeat protein (TIGR01451 family)